MIAIFEKRAILLIAHAQQWLPSRKPILIINPTSLRLTVTRRANFLSARPNAPNHDCKVTGDQKRSVTWSHYTQGILTRAMTYSSPCTGPARKAASIRRAA